MPGHRLSQSEYALQQVVKYFGTFLYSLEEHRVIHTYRVIVRFCKLEDIDHLVLRYLDTALLPFEEFSEELLFDGKA